jgi:hypothetical protein
MRGQMFSNREHKGQHLMITEWHLKTRDEMFTYE